MKEELKKILNSGTFWVHGMSENKTIEITIDELELNKKIEALSSYIKERERKAVEGFVEWDLLRDNKPNAHGIEEARRLNREVVEQFLNERTNE